MTFSRVGRRHLSSFAPVTWTTRWGDRSAAAPSEWFARIPRRPTIRLWYIWPNDLKNSNVDSRVLHCEHEFGKPTTTSWTERSQSKVPVVSSRFVRGSDSGNSVKAFTFRLRGSCDGIAPNRQP